MLITQDHVNLTLAPFSTLLTFNAAAATANTGTRWGRLGDGRPSSGPAPYRNFFSVSVPVAGDGAVRQVGACLPAGERQTAAYPEVNDPFADPPVTATEADL